MNPQDTNPQDQSNVQGQPQAQPLDDAQVESKYIIESAQQILAAEQTEPGSQDPEALAWARQKINNPPVAASPAVPQPPTGPIATSQGGDEGEIVWDKPADPTVNPTVIQPTPDNATTNGENNGNSN